ncbi:MAG: ketopantoate reductase C-terminal domain-containing protein, partial [Chloroflexota bacterium]
RRTEAEDVVGDLVRRARALGVAIPATETCFRLVRGMEDGFRDLTPWPPSPRGKGERRGGVGGLRPPSLGGKGARG